jgi:hypothetical protein
MTIWLEYVIEQAGKNFKIRGEWEGELMGVDADGSQKDNYLYKPGDVFRVNEHGWLCHISGDDGVNRD